MKGILNHKLTQFISAIIIFAAVIIIMYPPHNVFFQKLSEFAPQLMLGMLLVSFIFLYFKQKRLMFIGLLSTGLIAFYLKTTSNSNMILPLENKMPKIKVAHINLSSIDKSTFDFKSYFNQLDADLISFQEYTPDWDKTLGLALMTDYPYAHKMKRADAFGLAVYSRRKFVRIDNFYFKDIPNIKITVGNLEKNITFISSYLPSFYPRSDMNSSNHLQQIKNEILSNNTPLIVSGDFNKMYWSADIVEFMELSRLENSRRSSTISNLNPYDHIFFTNDLECIHFEELVDEQQNHIGISGIYQIDKN